MGWTIGFDHPAALRLLEGGPDRFRARKLAGLRRKIEPPLTTGHEKPRRVGFFHKTAERPESDPQIETPSAQTSRSPTTSPDSSASFLPVSRRTFWTRKAPPRTARSSPDSSTARTSPGAPASLEVGSIRQP